MVGKSISGSENWLLNTFITERALKERTVESCYYFSTRVRKTGIRTDFVGYLFYFVSLDFFS